MKATHRDYLHHRYLRVETGERYSCWNMGQGYFIRTAVCLAPSASDYQRLYRASLPAWKGGKIVDGVEVPL